jgi:chromosomal replication initiator protein
VVNGVTTIDFPAADWPAGEQAAPPGNQFVAGSENRLAVAALQHLLQGDPLCVDALWCSPLVLTGPTGVGKSHLARGIARHWSQLIGEQGVGYFTAIDFARQLRDSRDQGELEQFRERLAALRLLVIENLQQLPQRVFVERELRDTLDTLADSGAAVVITARDVTPLDAGLRDRLLGGMTLRLSPPGVEARREILQMAAESRGIALADDRLQSLAQHTEGPVPLLMRALAEQQLQSTTGENVASACREPIALKQIVAVVARYYSLTQAALVSAARRKSLVHARQVVVYLARLLTDMSYAQIGQGLGRRDHSTIMHAQRCLQNLAATDPTTQRDLEELRRIITAV